MGVLLMSRLVGLSTSDRILTSYRNPPRRSVANGTGLVLPDNRNPLVYRKISAWYGYSFARYHCWLS